LNVRLNGITESDVGVEWFFASFGSVQFEADHLFFQQSNRRSRDT
jgi:hypothetical protein